MRPRQPRESPRQSRALIQIVITVALVVILVVIAEATQALWLYYVIFTLLGLSLLRSWLDARRR
jgi:hypothetical protein